ncbi:MAG: EF-hand domain-containing protein [Pelagibacteraceae bacterium]
MRTIVSLVMLMIISSTSFANTTKPVELSKDQYVSEQIAKGMSESEAIEKFQELDQNDDGKLSPEELKS